MDRQIQIKSTLKANNESLLWSPAACCRFVGNTIATEKRQQAAALQGTGHGPIRTFLFPRLLSLLFVLCCASTLMADSLASQNSNGNKLFAQGKYQDAEKAYLDAEVKHPGRPEILYNLGNSLIKQKKYEKGVQTLRQSGGKGEKEIRENSWYNSGNAYFLMGDYKDSSDAFIQALRLNPADKDAKHNLELALMKLKQQQQQQSKPDQGSRNSQNTKQDQSSRDKQKQGNTGNQRQPEAGRQSAGNLKNEGPISKEQAMQILDALKNQELQDQRMLFRNRAIQKSNSRDW
jgi:Ca-activated chloride channel homolog